jgi:hypothetical protein
LTHYREINHRSLFLLLLILAVFPLQAQKKFVQGYIVSWNGDTLHGWLKDRSPGASEGLHSRIRFKTEDAWFRKKYGPEDLAAYGYGGQVFESLPLREESQFFRFRYTLDDHNKRIFLKVIARNKPLTWYHWEYIDAESETVEYFPLFHKDYSPEMVRVTQGVLGLKRKRLMEYFQDCPDLVKVIENREINNVEEVYNFYLAKCSDQKLDGKWMMYRVIQDGNDVTTEHNPYAERYILFFEDGTFETGGRPYGPNTGQYSYSSEQHLLYLYSDAGPEDDSQWKITIEKDTMTWQGLGSEWANRFRIVHHRPAL